MFSSKTQSGGRTQIENSNFHGFSDQPVTITKFYPTIEVMKSKEQPKKIQLLGSNGTVYISIQVGEGRFEEGLNNDGNFSADKQALAK